MKTNIITLLLFMVSIASMAQYNRHSRIDFEDDDVNSFFKIGTQIPLQHSIIYDHRITPAFSINAGLGLLAAPYPGLITSSLESKKQISKNDKQVIDRSYQLGISYQIGANFHFDKNYIKVFGQMAHLNADLEITDLVNLYTQMNIPQITGLLNPIDIRSTVPMLGLSYGRRLVIPGTSSEIHIEGSIAKTLGHTTKYSTGTLLDNIGILNDVVFYEIENDLDDYFSSRGWLPSINIYYVYKF